ncbi:serine hydrolase [Embleya sp. NPDC005971]|uniref:D-alanyl-D-alanine carboxypeptidase family protein n=2 Tax=unclassified Embleya TaxID=2699296 RepID=UPI00340D29CF
MSDWFRASRKPAVFCAAALVFAFVPAPAALAAGSTPEPQPPTPMSDIGGPRLAQAGVQSDLPPGTPPLPAVEGWSWVVADADTGKILAAKNPHWKLPPASTLKMLFADTVLPKIDRNTTRLVAPADLQNLGEGSSLVGIKENETYKVEDLWRGVFLRSGNDAVHVLCAMNGGVPATVQQMNERAKQLQAGDTNVVSPDGYDAPGQVSSAYDLALFAREGLKNNDFRSYASTKVADFPGVAGAKFQIQNTNTMLGQYPGMIGVKNGYTTNAGNTFVGGAQRGGHTLLVSLMHVEGKGKTYEDTGKLLDWGFAALAQAKPVGALVEPLAVPGGDKKDKSSKSAQAGSGDAKTAHAASSSKDKGFNWGLWAGLGVPAALVLGGGVLFALRRREGNTGVRFEDMQP